MILQALVLKIVCLGHSIQDLWSQCLCTSLHKELSHLLLCIMLVFAFQFKGFNQKVFAVTQISNL